MAGDRAGLAAAAIGRRCRRRRHPFQPLFLAFSAMQATFLSQGLISLTGSECVTKSPSLRTTCADFFLCPAMAGSSSNSSKLRSAGWLAAVANEYCAVLERAQYQAG